MRQKYAMPCHYDGKPFACIGGKPIIYQTESGRYLCPQCVTDNLNKCTRGDDPDWAVIAHTEDYAKCDECQRGRDDAANQ